MVESMNPNVLIYYPNEKRGNEVGGIVAERFPRVSVNVVCTPEQAEPLVADAEIIAGWGLPPTLLSKASRLRWFHKFGAGVDDIVLAGTLPDKALLTRTDGRVFGGRMAEYVIAYMLAHTQNMRRIFRQQSERNWKPFATDIVAGKTVGIAGVGDIGQEVVRRAAALDMRVVAWRRTPAEVDGVERTFAGPEQFHPFLAECDFVVVVLPLTPDTQDLFDDAAFGAMKDGAYFINVGRGPIVQEQALIQALESGKLGGAALDVFNVEPLPTDHPFWRLDNVTVTPHMSGPIPASELCAPFLDNLERYLAGQPLLKQVDTRKGY